MNEQIKPERFMLAERRTGMIEFHIGVRGAWGCIDFHFWVSAPGRAMMRVDSECDPFIPIGVEFHRRCAKEDANRESCSLLGGAPCHHDGTSLWASEVISPAFVQGGSDAVWDILERRYIAEASV